MVWNIYRHVAQLGIRVLLDGHDGDTVVSHGYKYLDELAVAGQWFKLAREIKGLAKHYGESPARLFQVYASHYGVDTLVAKHRSLKQGRRVWRALKRRLQRSDDDAESENWQDLLNSSFAAQTRIADRRKAWRKTLSNSARTEREGHYRTLVQPIQAFALEVHDNAAAAFSIEKRYPFWDRRVVEFCLSLPPDQKMNRGWTRVVLRRAMAGILPEEVQWRGGKIDFTPSLRYGLKSFDRELLDSVIVHEPGFIESYINMDTLRRTYERFLNADSSNSTDVFNIWKCASLALWLRQTWSS
jgi:asparagine synthase (glutamine-hydrolysing)